MPKNYNQIYTSVYTTGNSMSFGNTMLRGNGIPLDITEVYDKFDNAVIYAATNAVAYEGQIVAVTENGDTTAYIITPAVQGKHSVTVEGTTTEYDVYLKPIGVIPTGDSKTIEVSADGAISLLGAAGAANGTLPMVDSETGKLVWKTLEDIGAGDGNDNTTYTFAKNEAGTGFIVTPLFNGQPIMEDGVQVKYELDFDDKFVTHDELGTAIGNYAEGETAATGLRAEIATKANAADVYTKDEVYTKTEADTKIAEEIGKKIHMSTEVVEALPAAEDAEANVIYLVPDEKNIESGAYIEYVLVIKDGEKSLEPIGTTDTDLSDYYVKSEVYTKDEVDGIVEEAVNGLNGNIQGVATDLAEHEEAFEAYKSEVSGSFSNVSTTISNLETSLYEGGYTDKEGNKIPSNIGEADRADARLITPDEIEKLAGLSFGEDGSVGISGTVAADKVEGLDARIETVVTGSNGLAIERGAEVNIIETVKVDGVALTPDADRAVNVVVGDKINTAIANYYTKTEVDGKIGTVNEAVNTANGLIQANSGLIAGLDAELDTLSGTVATNSGDIAGLKTTTANNTGAIEALQTEVGKKADTTTVDGIAERVGANEGKVATNIADIAALKGRVEGHDTALAGVDAKLAGITEGQTVLGLINAAKEAATYNDAEVRGLIAANTTAITNEAARADAAEKVNAKAIADEIARADAAEKANAKAIADEADRAKAAEKVNADAITAEIARATAAEQANATEIGKLDAALKLAVENDAEGIDSIKELADWVNKHGEDAAELTKNIQANAAAIAANVTAIAANKTATETNAAAIEANSVLIAANDTAIKANAALITANDTAIKANAANIKANADALAVLNGTGEGSVAKMIADAAPAIATADVAGLVKSSTGHNAVTVAEDGTMSVATVKVSSLFQDATLVLNGGNASGEVE